MNANLSVTAGLIIGLGLFLAGCESSPLNGQPSRAVAKGPTLVAQQQKFCQIVLDGANEYGRIVDQDRAEHNPLRSAALEKQEIVVEDKMWDALYAFVGPSGEFAGWRGRASVQHPDRNGRIKVGFTSGCRFPINGLYFGMSTGESNAIPLASPLGQALATLDESKDVIVSGVFLWAPKGGGGWPCGMQFSDRHHFLPIECVAIPSLGGSGVSMRLTSIAQAH
jgi:hypothetical protein